jgi:hypothetical protein
MPASSLHRVTCSMHHICILSPMDFTRQFNVLRTDPAHTETVSQDLNQLVVDPSTLQPFSEEREAALYRVLQGVDWQEVERRVQEKEKEKRREQEEQVRVCVKRGGGLMYAAAGAGFSAAVKPLLWGSEPECRLTAVCPPGCRAEPGQCSQGVAGGAG